MSILGAIFLDTDTNAAHLFSGGVGGAGVSIAAGASRSGTNSLRLSNTTNGTATQGLGSNLGTAFVAFGFLPSSLPGTGNATFLQFLDSTTAQVVLKVLGDGTVQAFRAATLLGASSPGAVAAGVYQHIEVTTTISATVGVVQVWVNSVSVLNLTGQNTKNTANSTVSQFTLIAPNSVNNDFCDIIWGDARIGDRRFENGLMPTGAGHYTQFTPSAGANWQNVDEVPPNDDTDFNDTTTVGAIDSFAHTALSASPLSIDAVIVQGRARDTTTGAASAAPFIRSGTTDSPGTAVTLNTVYQNFQSVYPTDPATGAAWANAAAVNAADIGYKKIS